MQPKRDPLEVARKLREQARNPKLSPESRKESHRLANNLVVIARRKAKKAQASQ